MFKKIISAIMAISLMLTLCACDSNQPESDNQSKTASVSSNPLQTLTLPYSAKDSLNPYSAKSAINGQLAMLMYDPLVKVTNDFKNELCLASSVTVEGKKCTIKLRDAQFSDGTNVSSDDVTYSINQAMKSETSYASQLKNISSYSASDSKTIIIYMKNTDPYFDNLLDFPIFKEGTTSLKDKNGRSLPPVGSGRYTFVFNETQSYLSVNEKHYDPNISIKKILLCDTPDDEALEHITEIGGIDIIYSDISNNNIPKMNGKRETVPMNNLVYLGVNGNKSKLSDQNIRIALSYSISRSSITDNAYYSFAVAANGIFNPLWRDSTVIQNINPEQNTDMAVAYFEKSGYNTQDGKEFLVNKNGEKLSLSILYNSENTARGEAATLISSQLKKLGIDATTEGVTFNQMKSRLESGDFELYIGEVAFLNNMDIRSAFNSKAKAVYGIREDSTVGKLLDDYYNGKSDIGLALAEFSAEMPFIPLCYRYGVLSYSQRISADLIATPSDIYYNISNLH